MPIGASEDATREGREGARPRARRRGSRSGNERGAAREGWDRAMGGPTARGNPHLLGVVARPGAESERGSRDLRRSRLRAKKETRRCPHGVVVRRDPARPSWRREGGGAPATAQSFCRDVSAAGFGAHSREGAVVCTVLISRARVDRHCSLSWWIPPRARHFSPSARLSAVGVPIAILAAAPSRRGGCRFWRIFTPRTASRGAPADEPRARPSPGAASARGAVRALPDVGLSPGHAADAPPASRALAVAARRPLVPRPRAAPPGGAHPGAARSGARTLRHPACVRPGPRRVRRHCLRSSSRASSAARAEASQRSTPPPAKDASAPSPGSVPASAWRGGTRRRRGAAGRGTPRDRRRSHGHAPPLAAAPLPPGVVRARGRRRAAEGLSASAGSPCQPPPAARRGGPVRTVRARNERIGAGGPRARASASPGSRRRRRDGWDGGRRRGARVPDCGAGPRPSASAEATLFLLRPPR